MNLNAHIELQAEETANPFDDVLSEYYLADEASVVSELTSLAKLDHKLRAEIEARATTIVSRLRRSSQKPPLIDQFLLEYGLSTEEGVILMRLAEALLRTPDKATRNMLFRDRLGAGDWGSHGGKAASTLVNISTLGLQISKGWIKASGGVMGRSLIARLGDRVLGAAVGQAMVIMGEHFVLGRTIDEAIAKSDKIHQKGFNFSYDMLGEAAMTAKDAERYFQAYKNAIETLAGSGRSFGGLSVKLSALHPRYEFAQAKECVPDLIAKVKTLAVIARSAGLGLAIDAEEVERLEVSLQVVGALIADPELQDWNGLSVVVQAYQRRAAAVIRWIAHEVRKYKRPMSIRLVKGAYWDSEIKRAQEMGLESYPVFTRKENTDLSYLACARLLFEHAGMIFPQFATHNAHTAAAIYELAPEGAEYEFQCLHGMGEALHAALIEEYGAQSRIYAPVGRHADLLPYLVRRLLENGANSSFVNQLFDPAVKVDALVFDPLKKVEHNSRASHPALPHPRDHLNGERLAAEGVDLTQRRALSTVTSWFEERPQYDARTIDHASSRERVDIINPAQANDNIGSVYLNTKEDVAKAVAEAKNASWADFPVAKRADILRDAARRLEMETPTLLPLIVREAGKSLNDAVAEIREAVDFCRYYADRCEDFGFSERLPLGTVACISPWNFPLAIFAGQVAASLAAGNHVVAKPAEQTPLIAAQCIRILKEAGVPENALQIVFGEGDVGGALVAAQDIDGVCFTGSTEVAKIIAATLADTNRSLAPLIAETGGINAMIIDSTALLEQAVADVVASAFQSAGQRCSACRMVCVQEDVADGFMEMLAGAMDDLRIGDPSDPATDVGPVIDREAAANLRSYISDMKQNVRIIAETKAPDDLASDLFVSPVAFESSSVGSVTKEVFGPVLHVVRFKARDFDKLVQEINGLGFGLTMGLHTRIDARAEAVAANACVGNLYVNRNQIGAVVGVQPFGGEGLSGTGPKAGGPHYLMRLSKDPALNSVAPSHSNATIQQDSADQDGLASLIDASRAAQKVWMQENRPQKLQQLAAAYSDDLERLEVLHSWASADHITHLPGPTGEANRIALHPRTTLVAFGGDDALDMRRQILLGLAVGSCVIAVETDTSREVIKAMSAAVAKAGLPKGVFAVASEKLSAALLEANIDGVLADGAQRPGIADRLCRRAGAILPVLSGWDAPERLCYERTVTIDLTAAGGNATLLAMT